MVDVKAGYIIGNLLIALAESKGVYEAPVPTLHKFGMALQHGPFSDGSALIHCSHQELIFDAEHEPLFYVYKRGNTHYIGISENVTIDQVKRRYIGFLEPLTLVKIYGMARREESEWPTKY